MVDMCICIRESLSSYFFMELRPLEVAISLKNTLLILALILSKSYGNLKECILQRECCSQLSKGITAHEIGMRGVLCTVCGALFLSL
jgi:hypothetical protein